MTLSSKRQVAKNTVLLYCRTFIVLIISLWTSRVILDSLGVEDYGVYNAVGGLISLFAVLTGSMSSAISRYVTFELGTGDSNKLRQVFAASVIIQLVFIVIILFLAETIGLWFLNNKMTIPDGRSSAANYVYQFTLVIFCVNLLSVPYNAALIAHEDMKTYAYVSVFDNVVRLIIAFLVYVSPFDKLIFYSLLMTILAVSIRLFYQWYCAARFYECRIENFKVDSTILSGLGKFAGWNMLGEIASIMSNQGISVLLNIFIGPAINAAYGIANQVNAAVRSFTNNFMTALSPTITKSYAEKDYSYMKDLVLFGARCSYYLLFILVLPIMLETQALLNVWLKTVPEYTCVFVRLLLLYSLVEILSQTIIRAVQATGDIKRYQIIVSSISLLTLPFAYLALKMGFNPASVLVVSVIIDLALLLIRMILLKSIIGISIGHFVSQVLIRVAAVSIVAATPALIIRSIVRIESFSSSLLICAISFVCSCAACFFVGCSKIERDSLLRKLCHKTQ